MTTLRLFSSLFGYFWRFLTTFGSFWLILAILCYFWRFWLVLAKNSTFLLRIKDFVKDFAHSGPRRSKNVQKCQKIVKLLKSFDNFKAIFVSFLATFGVFWLLLAIFGYFWRFLTTFGYLCGLRRSKNVQKDPKT